MENNDFYAAFQIDCEATQHAINDAGLGERASRGFADLLEGDGFRGTFFVIPTDIEASGKLYQELVQRGHEVGLHIHPADLGYQEFLGVYGLDEQLEIINIATDRFAQIMGYRPKGICIGYVSGNDYTFNAMVKAGFKHGMLSIPTRVLTSCASVWAGAPLDIHYANAYNRILSGTLDLVDVPLTIDPESRMWGGLHPQDLRIELVDAKNHWYTIKKEVDRKIRCNSPVKYLLSITHNTFDYSDAGNFRTITLKKVLSHIRNIVVDTGGMVKKATMADIAAFYRKVCPLTEMKDPQLALDTSGRS